MHRTPLHGGEAAAAGGRKAVHWRAMHDDRHRPSEDARRALERAHELGFALAGVAPAEPSRHGEHVRSWLAEQRHGEMHYLADPLDVRLDPNRLVPGAKSILLVADAYPTEEEKGPRGRGAGGSSVEGQASDATRAGDPGTEHRSPVTGHRSPARSPLTIHHAPLTSRIARYAWGDDYHKVMKKRLFALADALRERHADASFRCCVDTAPLLEREHAAAAGMGWIGKHTLLLHPRHGSFLLLGAIVTDLDLATSEAIGYPRSLVPPTDRCGTCTRCIDACPTGCIFDPRVNDYPGPHADGAGAGSEERAVGEDHTASPFPGVQRAGEAGVGSEERGAGSEEREAGSEERGASVAAPPRAIDASQCISYLTIEHRSAIDPKLHAPMGDWLIGCDVCQDVCPYNNASATQHALDTDTPAPREPLPIHLRYRPREELAVGLDPFEVLQWAEDDRRRVFQGSALKRVKLDMLHRNALIVLTNAAAGLPPDDDRRAAALAETQRLTDDPNASPLVRETARVCQSRLQSRSVSAAK